MSLLIGNIVSVALTGALVPSVADCFGWWLRPTDKDSVRTSIVGAVFILAMYAVIVVVFRVWF